MKRIRGSFQIGVLAFALSSAVWAQSTAQISGTVRDQSGAVLPGAEIKATQTATGAVRNAVSAEDGRYVLTSLPIGPYVVEVSLPGFRTYVQSGIVLQVDSNPTINAALQVGQVTEQIEVQADAALVETHSTGVGTVIDNQRVLELPLNGRNVTELIFLAGMATPGNGNNSIRNYPTVVVSVAGGLGGQMTFLLDGANHNDSHSNLNLPLPFPDALQEYKVETSALPAQYGIHGAATVNAVTKAGTNDFHGDLFEFVRNGMFNARDFFATTRDSLKRNQFGGVLGGPIKANKLFFFGGYQGTIQRSTPPQNIAFVPTPAMLAGDFTALTSPPCTSAPLTLAPSQGFVNNQISPARFNPVALNLEKLLPTTTDPCGKVTYALRANQTEHLAVGRLDYQKSQKNSMFGRFTMADLDQPTSYDGKNPLTVLNAGTHFDVYSLALGNTYLIGSSIVSSFRASMTRSYIPKVADNFTTWKALGSNVTPLAPGEAKITINGGFAIGGGSSHTTKNATGPNPFFSEDLSVLKGAHQLGFGGSYLLSSASFYTALNSPATFTFNGSVTGHGLADFLLGSASGSGGNPGLLQGNDGSWYDRYHYIGLYAQDAWKVNSRLTVNYGVRFEPYLAMHAHRGTFTHFDQTLFDQNVHSTVYPNAPAGLIVPGDPQYKVGNAPEGSKLNIFVPRIGLVWDPKGDGRMTVRAAYGMFTDRNYIQEYTGFATNPPVGNNISLTTANLTDPWATYPGGNPFPLQLGKNLMFGLFGTYLTANFNNYKPPYLNQWNLSIQRQLGNDWLVTANYVGNNIIHLLSGVQLNPAVFMGMGPCTIPGPSGPVNYTVCSTTANTNQRRVFYLRNPAQGQYYAAMSLMDNGGTESYNGLFLSVQKRLSRGFTLLTNYTWSHCISDVFDNQFLSGSVGTRSDTRRASRGNCGTSDQRHVFNLSAVAQAPKFSNHTMHMIAGDWQFSPILKIKSGQYFSVTTGVDNALTGLGSQTPNPVPGVSPYAGVKTIDHWLNRAAFASPMTGTYGAVGLNTLQGPSIFQLDMAVSRTFKVAEKKTLQLRGEAFNLPNHMVPNNPVSALNNTNFGRILSDTAVSGAIGPSIGPRIIQLALKLVF